MMHTSSETVHGCESCMIRKLTQTFSLPAPFVILPDIAHALQMATVCMLAHVSSLWTVSDYGAYRKRLCFTNRVCRNNLGSVFHRNLIDAFPNCIGFGFEFECMLQLYSYPSGSNNPCIIRFIGTYVQELHKNRIKNDEPQFYTCTIKDGKERGEIYSGCWTRWSGMPILCPPPCRRHARL